jgi:hypothetical protein
LNRKSTAPVCELEEHVDLGLEDLGVDRLEQEVDRAGLVALEHPGRVARAGGDEDDRDVLGARGAAHQLGELEPVHVGHLDVDQRDRDVVDQQQLERLGAGPGAQRLDAVAAEQGLERDEVLDDVVDDQHLGRFGLHGHRLW